MEFVYEKQPVKVAAYEDVLRKTGVTESEVAFLGDDLPGMGGSRVPAHVGPAGVQAGASSTSSAAEAVNDP